MGRGSYRRSKRFPIFRIPLPKDWRNRDPHERDSEKDNDGNETDKGNRGEKI